ncbi:hypothetical protein NNJEOMEG_03535 [Fundidesulfovibrio magnetotacticus]|uniref:4Fe-4S domain-containing protein n=1 Tax=Fundidesulfovibrio magnetotacticus TaxID=2730080 RepID=A0A6V8M1E0_9BACT|nr:molybdopterin-guanine dinucleotide biosynthesis protein MobB [Fundidesulfovibrio magnetotacticus]GFK95667.1 hypothetical protein NNJEOMEG_03535 [Fundidesulfovibrio magnetotacticus]
MRAVNVVGFKDTGKTTLAAGLLEGLTALGLAPAALKFTHQAGLDKQGTDTAKLLSRAVASAAIGEAESAVFWREKKHLRDMLALLGSRTVVVEGGKDLGVMPRIVIAADQAQARQLGAGEGGLALAVYGPEGVDGVPAERDVAKLARLAAERGFLLPGLDCGGCGRASCRELAVEIVAGRAAPEDCTAQGGEISVTMNGVPLGLNPFVARMLKAGLAGMLRELKGFTPGETVITLKL